MHKITAIIVCLALLLCGCSSAVKTGDLNADGTVGSLKWGMTNAEAAEAGGFKASDKDQENMSGKIKLFDTECDILLSFFDYGDGEMRLGAIDISSALPKQELISKVSEIWGERNATGFDDNGNVIYLDEEDYNWHSKDSFWGVSSKAQQQALIDDALEKVGAMGVTIEGIEELISKGFSTRFLWSATVYEDAGTAALHIDGKYSTIDLYARDYI